jgi:hypothetical protein
VALSFLAAASSGCLIRSQETEDFPAAALFPKVNHAKALFQVLAALEAFSGPLLSTGALVQEAAAAKVESPSRACCYQAPLAESARQPF